MTREYHIPKSEVQRLFDLENFKKDAISRIVELELKLNFLDSDTAYEALKKARLINIEKTQKIQIEVTKNTVLSEFYRLYPELISDAINLLDREDSFWQKNQHKTLEEWRRIIILESRKAAPIALGVFSIKG